MSDHVPEYASDDETLYGRQNNPDPEDREFFYDEIDEFHADRDKVTHLIHLGYDPESGVSVLSYALLL